MCRHYPNAVSDGRVNGAKNARTAVEMSFEENSRQGGGRRKGCCRRGVDRPVRITPRKQMSPPSARGVSAAGWRRAEPARGGSGQGCSGGDLTGRQMNRAHGIHALRIQFPICATRTTGGPGRVKRAALFFRSRSRDLSSLPLPSPSFTEECSNLPRPRAQLTSPDRDGFSGRPLLRFSKLYSYFMPSKDYRAGKF